MSNALRSARLGRAQDALTAAGFDWLFVPASADFRWLTGAPSRISERLVALALPRHGEPFIVVPKLESGPLAAHCEGIDLLIWEEHEDPLARLVERCGLQRGEKVLIAEGMRVAQVLRLAALAECAPALPVLGPLRAVKDEAELEALAEAARHADLVVEEAADFARPGMSEREVARFIARRFEELGDTDVWSIVGSGPNSADPHHSTSDRILAEGETLLLDLGAFTRGYGSDITRTYFLGEPPRQVTRAFEVVNAARAAGVEAARSGALCEDVDRAARSVIEDAGLGEYFTHRTGHGLGLEIHEPPYLVRGNHSALATGNVHSVEPGVYFPGKFGIRIEDIVVTEASGGRRLNQAPIDMRPPRARR